MTTLLPCPVCSHLLQPSGEIIEHPRWLFAPTTSAKRGVRCAILSGCTHVQAFAKFAIVQAPDADAVVQAWNADAVRLFAARTERWPDHLRERLRVALQYPQPAAA